MLDTLFTGFFVLVFAYGMYEVWDIPLLARIFPFWISLVAFVLSIVQLAIAARRSSEAEGSSVSAFADLAPDRSMPARIIYRKAVYYVGWLLGLYAAIWLIGFVMAMTLFVLTFLRWEAKKGWLSCTLMSLCSGLFIVGISWVMTLYWPEGQLGQLLDLPWPFT